MAECVELYKNMSTDEILARIRQMDSHYAETLVTAHFTKDGLLKTFCGMMMKKD
jgi:hypothetical protein